MTLLKKIQMENNHI